MTRDEKIVLEAQTIASGLRILIPEQNSLSPSSKYQITTGIYVIIKT